MSLEELVAEGVIPIKKDSKNLDIDEIDEGVIEGIADDYSDEFESPPKAVSSNTTPPEKRTFKQLNSNPPRQSPRDMKSVPVEPPMPKAESPQKDLDKILEENQRKPKEIEDNAAADENDSFHRLYNKEIKVNQDEIPLLLMELTDIAYKFIMKDQFDKAYVLL